MLEAEEVLAWLRQSGDLEAADLLSRLDFTFHWVDLAFEFQGERQWEIHDLSLFAPPDILKSLEKLAGPVGRIESAFRELAGSAGCHIRDVTWMPRIPHAAEVSPLAELSVVDAPHVRDLWVKAVSRVPTDPSGAVTAARSLLESVCKHVLFDRGVPFSSTAELPQLFDAVLQVLSFSPRAQTDRRLRRVAGNVQAVVGGVASLRADLGDAHGKRPDDPTATPEQAELAVNLAGAVALYVTRTAAASSSSRSA